MKNAPFQQIPWFPAYCRAGLAGGFIIPQSPKGRTSFPGLFTGICIKPETNPGKIWYTKRRPPVFREKRDAGVRRPSQAVRSAAAEGAALRLAFVGDVAAAAVHADIGGLTAALAVILAPAGFTPDAGRTAGMAAGLVHGRLAPLLFIGSAAGLAAGVGVVPAHMDAGQGAAAPPDSGRRRLLYIPNGSFALILSDKSQTKIRTGQRGRFPLWPILPRLPFPYTGPPVCCIIKTFRRY